MRAPAFDYAAAGRDEIRTQALGLEGKTLLDLRALSGIDVDLNQVSSSRTKGLVGRVYEAAFGIPPNSIAGPDFPAARVELKSVPILIDGKQVRAKERISLGMIDFAALPTERWPTAKIRQKLEDLLLIFYEWAPDQPLATFRTLKAYLWRPDQETLAFIEQDWLAVQRLVALGRRHEISEGTSKILGAATKGAGHWVDPAAPSRAWTLRQPFVTSIYSDAIAAPSVIQSLGAHSPADFESSVIAAINQFEGIPLREVARRLGLSATAAKNGPATIVRKALGLPSKGRAREFAQFGIEVKTVPLSPQGRPYEAMSFRSFRHMEIVHDGWDDSDLLGHLGRLLIVPLVRAARRTPLLDAVIRGPLFWSPDPATLSAIRDEWERFRAAIAAGRADRLPRPSETRYLHVRPKARDRTDTEDAPGGLRVVKKAFWLNQEFVRDIIQRSGH